MYKKIIGFMFGVISICANAQMLNMSVVLEKDNVDLYSFNGKTMSGKVTPFSSESLVTYTASSIVSDGGKVGVNQGVVHIGNFLSFLPVVIKDKDVMEFHYDVLISELDSMPEIKDKNGVMVQLPKVVNLSKNGIVGLKNNDEMIIDVGGKKSEYKLRVKFNSFDL